ncbi:type VI secretion system tube protein TssD [Flavobacterium branchiarum]|uniref:Type VI secretion system tube protein TssD n=1 Tax=Flavobacterium branchiarum TaxID=1114870 RepID=A0ABV5FS37_9FLAO|nr:type VI secretion system tube protein TssD [Flavobacterium branchiarum]MDN3672792.1 type VI secretion system tube protein TssD [Flavobacterium branchiarum]
MSFLSKLHIDGEEYNVLEFNIGFKQQIDSTSKPAGEAKGGVITMIIEASQNSHFLSWMLNGDLTKDGKIVFYRRDALSKMKELTFTKAFCVSYDEQFTSTTEVPMKITMELVAKELVFGDAKFSNNWIALN